MVNELDHQTKTRPVLEAGRDYSRTYRYFVKWFPDNDSCVAFLIKLRWPDGFICLVCGSKLRLILPMALILAATQYIVGSGAN